MSEQVQIALIQGIVTCVGTFGAIATAGIGAYVLYLQLKKAAVKVDEVKETLAKVTAKHGEKLDILAEKMEEVHLATNSLTDRLVESTGKEQFLAGGAAERKKQEGGA
mgnify:CR=1 FL=1